MAEYDIASKVVPPKFDPLAVAGQVQSLQAQQLQNKILGQQAGSALSMGRAFGSAIGEDGLDPSKVPEYYAQHPDEAQYAPAAIQAAQTQREAQLKTSIAQQNLTQAQLATSAAENANVVQLDQAIRASGDTSKANVIKMIDAAAPAYFKSPESQKMVEAFKAQLSDDPAANDALLKQTALSHGTVAKVLGEMQTQDTGPGVVAYRADTGTGAITPTGFIQKGLSPSEANTPAYAITDENGQQHIVTKAEAAEAAKTGKQPTGITSGMKVGTPELASQGVQFETGLTHAAQSWGDVHGQLSNFRTLVDGLTAGPKAGAIKKVEQIATQFGLAPPAMKNDAAALEEAGKLAYQIAQRQFQQLGGTGTDSKLDSAMHTSPSEFLTREGNKRIIPLLQGNNDALKAQAEAYQTWKASHGPQEFTKFVTQWNQHYDPRVFQAAYMTPAEVTAMKKGMGKEERQNFDAFSAFAKGKGWLGGG